MPRKPSTAPKDASSVDKYIGTAFDKVKTVADNIDDVIDVADNIDNILESNNNSAVITTVANNITDVKNTSSNMEDVRKASENVDNINIVADNVNNTEIVASNITDVLEVSEHMSDVVAAVESASSAATSAQDASNSATLSEASAEASSVSAGNAAISEANAETYKNEALVSEQAAQTYKEDAESARDATNSYKDLAYTYQESANTSSVSAESSKNAAEISSTNAQTSAESASASAATALSASTEAENYAINAATSASGALTSSVSASTSETNASISENNATNSASSASASEANAEIYMSTTLTYKNSAESSAVEAAASESNALIYSNNAQSSASNSSDSADEASASATLANTYSNSASTSATNAATSSNASSTSAANAAASEASAEAFKNNAANSAATALEQADRAEEQANIAEAAAITASNGVFDRGAWDASSGSFPTPNTDPVETSDWYRISVGGTMSDGIQSDITVAVGDNLYWDKTNDIWYKIDNTDQVTSVQGRQGAVTISKTDVGLSNVSNYSISDVYSSNGTNYASRTALYNAYTALNSNKLGINEDAANALLLQGYDVHTSRNNESHKIVKTDGNGAIQAGWINTTSGDASDDVEDFYVNTGDNYIRRADLSTVKSTLGIDTVETTLSNKLNSSEYTASDILTKLKTVDGSSSGLDADLLDGQNSSYYLNASYINAGTLPTARLSGTYGISVSGNASTATKLATARTIGITGDITATAVSFDGSSNISISASVKDDSHSHTIANVNGLQSALDDKVDSSQVLTNVPANAVFTDTNTWRPVDDTPVNGQTGESISSNWAYDHTASSSAHPRDTRNLAVGSNAVSASKLATARTISLTGDASGSASFDGTSNVSINVTLGSVSGTPSGAVQAFAMQTAPTGWLAADGSAVSRTTYADLYAAIGDTYGSGDESTTFNLPDLRGEFIRGYDDGRGVDDSRTFGSWQESDNKAHTHSGTANSAGNHRHGIPTRNSSYSGTWSLESLNRGKANGTYTSYAGAHTHSLSISSSGGTEARPRNVALLYCIKY